MPSVGAPMFLCVLHSGQLKPREAVNNGEEFAFDLGLRLRRSREFSYSLFKRGGACRTALGAWRFAPGACPGHWSLIAINWSSINFTTSLSAVIRDSRTCFCVAVATVPLRKTTPLWTAAWTSLPVAGPAYWSMI